VKPAGRVLLALVAVALGAVLIFLYRSHQEAVVREASRESPVVAPTRLHEIEGRPLVVLDQSAIDRVGLETAPLRAASAPTEVRLPAEVIPEPERTVVLRAPLSGRLTVPGTVAWPRLGTRVSAGEEIARVSDARPLSSPLTGVVTRVGAQPGEIVEAGQVLLELVDNSRPMVRVAWTPTDNATPPRSVILQPPGTSIRVKASLVGLAAEADPATRRPAYFYRAERQWAGAAPGTPVVALMPLPRSPGAGWLIPARAVVQWEGLAWAYVQRGAGRYARVAVSTDHPVPGGWLAESPFTSGDTIVVSGGQELLSEEFRARVTVGDESGE
jgi:biotin carboxyl carrier protein